MTDDYATEAHEAKDKRIAELEGKLAQRVASHQIVIDLANEQHIRIANAFGESTDQFFDKFTDAVIGKYEALQTRIKAAVTLHQEALDKAYNPLDTVTVIWHDVATRMRYALKSKHNPYADEEPSKPCVTHPETSEEST